MVCYITKNHQDTIELSLNISVVKRYKARIYSYNFKQGFVELYTKRLKEGNIVSQSFPG